MNVINRGLTLAFSLALLAPAVQAADEAKDVAKAPQAVLDTLNKEFPGAKITECDKEKEDGVESYEVELVDAKGEKHKLHLTLDGTIMKDKNKTTGEKTKGEAAK